MKELLFSVTKNDFIIEWFSGKGAGGQHRNKHQNCCRIKHPPSGAIATVTSSKSREQNKKQAFKNLVNSVEFQTWLKRKIAEETLVKEEIEKWLNEQMRPENLKIEYL